MCKSLKPAKNSVSFKEVRRALNFHNGKASSDSFYPVNESNASRYFACSDAFKGIVSDYFSKLHFAGVRIVHLDICGRATIQSLGGDMSYCFSLNDESRTDWHGNSLVNGDLFSGKDFSRFLKQVNSDQEAPALITFRPIAGLQSNTPYFSREDCPKLKEVTEGILEKRFGQCVAVLRKGGYMYLEKPFQFDDTIMDFLKRIPQEEYGLAKQVKALAKKYHCDLKIEESIGGPTFLVRKKRTT